MMPHTHLIRGLGIVAAITGAAFTLAACTYVDRTPAQPATTVVTPAPAAPATVVAPAPTVTVRPSY